MKERPLHVLLIDDDEDEFIVIRDLLAEAKTAKFKVEWTSDISEARKKMLQQSYDIFLLDYRLGEISGIDLLKEVMAQGCRAPVILLTAYHDEDIDREAMNVGAADYLEKGGLTPYLLERALRYGIYRNHMQAQAVSHDRIASIGLLASSFAHEIGTPLGVIRGRAELLGLQAAGNENIQKNVDIITSQIDRVSTLVRSLLNLAGGDKSEKIESLSVNKALSGVLDLLAHEFKINEIKIINTLDPAKPIIVRGQTEKLHQVFLNLILNAVHAIVKAKEDGRVTDHYIKFSCQDLGIQYAINIEDSGCGISESNSANLFRPFFSTKGPGKGTGLGLSTSLWIVQSWAGTIKMTSKEDAGTTFQVILSKNA